MIGFTGFLGFNKPLLVNSPQSHDAAGSWPTNDLVARLSSREKVGTFKGRPAWMKTPKLVITQVLKYYSGSGELAINVQKLF